MLWSVSRLKMSLLQNHARLGSICFIPFVKTPAFLICLYRFLTREFKVCKFVSNGANLESQFSDSSSGQAAVATDNLPWVRNNSWTRLILLPLSKPARNSAPAMDGIYNLFDRTVKKIVNHDSYQALLSEHSKETDAVELCNEEQHSHSIRNNEFIQKYVPLVKSIFIFLLPSFIKDLQHNSNPVRVPPTAYLNGLRRIAAYFVSCQHFTTIYYSKEPLWGYGARPQDVWITQLPFFRHFLLRKLYGHNLLRPFGLCPLVQASEACTSY
jgi:hypothetical protein